MFQLIKILIQASVCLMMLSAFNVASADESLLSDLFGENKVETESSNKEAVIKPKTNKALNTQDVKKQTVDSNARSLNSKKVSSPRKTHYGIGYEYRRSLQEKVVRVERSVRTERVQRPQRVERIERPERLDRPERPERIDRPDRHGR